MYIRVGDYHLITEKDLIGERNQNDDSEGEDETTIFDGETMETMLYYYYGDNCDNPSPRYAMVS